LPAALVTCYIGHISPECIGERDDVRRIWIPASRIISRPITIATFPLEARNLSFTHQGSPNAAVSAMLSVSSVSTSIAAAG
jgi:hypothetical protein